MFAVSSGRATSYLRCTGESLKYATEGSVLPRMRHLSTDGVWSDGRGRFRVKEERGVVIGALGTTKLRLGRVETRRDATLVKSRNDWWEPGAWRRGEMSRRRLGLVARSQCAERAAGSESRLTGRVFRCARRLKAGWALWTCLLVEW